MKFEAVEKGWEYRTDGYTLKKSYKKEIKVNTGFATLNTHKDVSVWSVYPDDGNTIYTFHLLKDAKAFCEKREAERSV